MSSYLPGCDESASSVCVRKLDSKRGNLRSGCTLESKSWSLFRVQTDFKSGNDPAAKRHRAVSLTFGGLIACCLRFDFSVDLVSAWCCRLTCLCRQSFSEPSAYHAFMESQIAALSNL